MYDIVIQGGGPSGIACAYIASKLGLKTLLVEKNNYLGGLMTGGLVAPVMLSNSKNLNVDFYNDLVLFAKKYNAQTTYCDGNEGWFNPELLKIVFDSMLSFAGADVLFEANCINFNSDKNKIISIVYKTNKLSVPIESKYYVDATGDGKLSELLKCDFLEDSGEKQPSSLRFVMSNVDTKEFSDFILKADLNRETTNSCITDDGIHFTTAYTWDTDKNWALKPIFDKALKNGDIKEFDTAYFQVFSISNAQSSVAFNCPRLKISLDDDIFSESEELIKGREAIFRLANFMKKYFRGFQKAYISNIAPITGVRLSKRVKTRYTYTIDDIVSSREFRNPVLYSDYPIDIHSNKKDLSELKKVAQYSLPLESLMSFNYQNLFITGRHIGVDFKAQAALRVQKSCMSMGEAVAKYVSSNINLCK